MSEIDEPLFASGISDREQGGPDTGVRERIARLVETEPYAVLCVQGGGQPYGALVAFVFSQDLRTAAFATPKATRKYRLLGECGRVALVFDSRASRADDFMEIEACTATGNAEFLEQGEELEHWSRELVARHPHLSSFVSAPSCAVVKVDIVRYLHVMRFQEVRQWVPPPRT